MPLDNTNDDKEAMKELDLFANELNVMQDLHHPLIVQFLGFNLTEEMGLAIFMEFLPNGSLEAYVKRRSNRIPLRTRRRWLDQMTQAVIYLHNRKPEALIHRWVEPTPLVTVLAVANH
jgi:serine/threonine protein kinase